jgi:glycosyltransferase involved in cell wall biosynthesis
MSNALLEAMSWGLPCIVSDVPGNRAVIDNETNGLVVPVNNAAALAEAIVRLLKNPSLRALLGSNARKKAESEYDIRRVTDRLLDIYRVVLDENRLGVRADHQGGHN